MDAGMMDWKLDKPCPKCGSTVGTVVDQGQHLRLNCATCGKYQKFLSREEAGLHPRTLTSVHNGIKPKQRARILERATGRCEICGTRGDLHVGHIISVAEGVAQLDNWVRLNESAFGGSAGAPVSTPPVAPAESEAAIPAE